MIPRRNFLTAALAATLSAHTFLTTGTTETPPLSMEQKPITPKKIRRITAATPHPHDLLQAYGEEGVRRGLFDNWHDGRDTTATKVPGRARILIGFGNWPNANKNVMAIIVIRWPSNSWTWNAFTHVKTYPSLESAIETISDPQFIRDFYETTDKQVMLY